MYRTLSLGQPQQRQRRGLGMALAARGQAPYRGLQNRDPAVNGLANLGAALMNGPRDRAAASKIAFDEQERHNNDLEDRKFRQGRATAQDNAAAEAHRDAVARGVQQDKFHAQAHADAEAQRKQAGDNAAAETARKTKQDYLTAEDRYVQEQERGRHNRADEAATAKGKPGTQADGSKLALELWNNARQAATSTEMVNGRPERHYDPQAHQQIYEQGRQLLNRPDVPEWKTANAEAQQGGDAAAPQGPPEQSSMTMRRSGLPGVHTLGDLTGGIVDLWGGEKGPAAAPGGAPASNAGMFDGGGAPAGAPMPAPGGAPAQNHPLDATLMQLHPADQQAFARILATGDRQKIAAAEARLQQLAGGAPAAPAALAAPVPAPMAQPGAPASLWDE